MPGLPQSTPIDWLSKAAYPALNQQTRQIEGFYPDSVGRLPWSVNSITSDGTVGLQWLNAADMTPITEPRVLGTLADSPVSSDKDYRDLTLTKPIYLEVDLPRLTENLELGRYVAPENASGIDETYYNTPIFFQHQYMDWKNVRVIANPPNTLNPDGTPKPWSGYVSWNSGLLGGAVATDTMNSGQPTVSANPRNFQYLPNAGIEANAIELDYKTKKLRLRFDANTVFSNYTSTYDTSNFLLERDYDGGDTFEYYGWLNSGSRLYAGSYFGPDGVPTGWNNSSSNTPDQWRAGTVPRYDWTDIQPTPFGTGPRTELNWYNRHVNPEIANRVGVVYQSKNYDEQVTQTFRAVNPDYSLYTTLGSANDTDSVWFLLAQPSEDTRVNSVEESLADSNGPDNEIIYPAPSQLLTVKDKNQITLNLTTQSVGSRSQLGQIANSKTSASGLTFSVFEKDVSSNVKPTSYRADIDDTNGVASPETATIKLESMQLDYGKRAVVANTDGTHTVTLQGLTISEPSAVQNVMAELGIDSSYQIAQIPVWLREKLGYSDSDQTVKPSQKWDIAVTLTYDDGTVAQGTANADPDPANPVVALVAENLNGPSSYPVVPTTLLNLTGLTVTSGSASVAELSQKGQPRVEITDSIFSQDQVTQSEAVPSNEWLLWTPTFNSMSEAFAILMSGYLQLFQTQLQLSSSVVDWYNGQIESLNDALSVVTSWGVGSLVGDDINDDREDSDTLLYSPAQTSSSNNPPGALDVDGNRYLRAQRDSVTWVLNQFNIDLNLYLQLNDGKNNGNLGGTYQWGDVNTGQSTFDNFNTEVKSAISNLTNVSQQQTTVFSNLTSSYSNGVSTLTQMLSKLTSTKQTILQKW